MNKPKIIKDYEKIGDEVLAQIKLKYPRGFEKYLIQFKNHKGKFISALPFETETHYYLIRMTQKDAEAIISEDQDYNDEGHLTEDARGRLEDQIADLPEEIE